MSYLFSQFGNLKRYCIMRRTTFYQAFVIKMLGCFFGNRMILLYGIQPKTFFQ